MKQIMCFEFENAKAGIASIETSFSAVLEKLPSLTEEKIAALFSNNARQIFNLPTANIVEGTNAELTLFNVNESTNMSKSDSASKSANSPFWDLTLKGKIIGTVVKNTLHINS